jgi:nitrogen fixation NifU-like protein
MNDFQEQILDNYKNPRNFGKPGWVPTHSAKLQNLTCGDEIEMFLDVQDGKIKDISFLGEGCSIAIATASLLSSELKGRYIADISNFQEQELFNLVGIELTTSRKNCALLPLQTTQKALNI